VGVSDTVEVGAVTPGVGAWPEVSNAWPTDDNSDEAAPAFEEVVLDEPSAEPSDDRPLIS
jgi:hypothetical protein